MAPENILRALNPFRLIEQRVREITKWSKRDKARILPEEEPVKGFCEENAHWDHGPFSQAIEVIIDGKIYKLHRDESGKFRYERNIGVDLLNLIFPKITTLLATGIATATVIINSINAVEIRVRYLDTLGNELYKEVIPQLVKEKTNDYLEAYLAEATESGRLDPRLIQKTKDVLRDYKQPK